MNNEIPQESFEEALTRLESLVKQLEKGDLTLEESLVAFEQGIKLTRHCQQSLQSAEQKVKMLIEEQGSVSIQTFPKNDPE